MKLTNPAAFRYSTAAESSKPGYLKRKFERIRKEQESARREAEQKTVQIQTMQTRKERKA